MVFPARLAKFLRISHLSQPKQIQRCNRARGRLGVVAVLFQSKQDARIIAGAGEITAVPVVPEEPVLRRLKLLGQAQPFHVKRGFIQIEQSLDVKGIVFGETADFRGAAAIASPQRMTLRVVKIGPNELSGARCGFQVICVAQHLCPAGEGGNHQPIPRCDDLVVEMGSRPFRPQFQKRRASVTHRLIDIELASSEMFRRFGEALPFVENVFAPKFPLRIAPFGRVSALFDAILIIEKFGVLAERVIDFLFRPNVEGTFGFLRCRRLSSGCLHPPPNRIHRPHRSGRAGHNQEYRARSAS